MRRGGNISALFGGFGSAFRVPRVRLLLGILLTLIAVSTLFYRWAEGWRYLDAVYFSVVTLATVGYGDFAPKTDAGKIFTVFLILSGIGLFVTTASAIAENMLAEAAREDEDL
jgi:voltage-gated potassium channel